MSSKKIIIDALYQDEIRVALCRNGILEEFKYQNSVQKILKGNIYLAKVERVEPALQAAFINYGSNRTGFLPMSEIHPRFYCDKNTQSDDSTPKNVMSLDDENFVTIKQIQKRFAENYMRKAPYIQNVIKKNQTILVQVEKDERGNKGASFSTFLSLSGRYCVLLINAEKVNIISKQINDDVERERLSSIASELSTFEHSAGIVIKSNAAYKTKLEITRDFGYLIRLWRNIKHHSANGEAPLFVHEEGDIIKQSLRDLCDNEVDEVIISGEKAYKETLDFAEHLLPRHVRKIKHYGHVLPIFIKYDVQQQIRSLYSDNVSLPSGGYIVINQTEALTSIDVNSGKSSSDLKKVEEMALKNNLEAAKEAARQIKLRDISGLIVIDFIDMMEHSGNTLVENIVRNELYCQNAKTSMSLINEFGLLSISRQRLGNSLYEASFDKCKHCNGRGWKRLSHLTVIAIFKAIHEEIASLNNRETEMVFINVMAESDVIMYIINERKYELLELESKHNIKIDLHIDHHIDADSFFIEKRDVISAKTHGNAAALSTISATHYHELRKGMKQSVAAQQTAVDNVAKYHNKNNAVHTANNANITSNTEKPIKGATISTSADRKGKRHTAYKDKTLLHSNKHKKVQKPQKSLLQQIFGKFIKLGDN